ncbi:MAG: hypothetical protein R3E13_06865 [Alphaproteobacteria bacterium]
MATKKQEINRLIRADYGYPVLQRFLAEIIYETRDFNNRDMEKRYNSLLKIILGDPQKKISKDGYRDDNELLSRAAVMTQSCFRKDIKTGTRLKRMLTVTEACEEIARMEHIKGYKFQTQLPDGITENDKEQIRATRLRLMGKLKGNIRHYGRLHFKYGTKQAFEYEETDKEIEFIKTLFPDWLQRFGSQVRFEEK